MRNSLFALAALTIPASAFAAQINTLSVVGGSADYGGFPNTNVLDTQTGSISEPGSGYWLNPDTSANTTYPYGDIVLSLGGAYQLGQVQLFNTHNTAFGDRGTGDFRIVGGNAISGGDLSGPTTVLVTSTLNAVSQANDPLPGQTFNIIDTGSYQYIRFEALSRNAATNGGSGCCGPNNSGLNEIRVFDAVPEPSSIALLGLAGLGSLVRRRRR